MDTDHVVLTALTPDMISGRISGKDVEEEK